MPFKKSMFIAFLLCWQCTPDQIANRPSKELRPSKFSIYIDAGSSGARLGIYSIEVKEDSSVLIKELADKSTSSGVGIHTLSKDLGQIPEYIRPLMQYAETFIGKEDFADTPVYVYGTGGLRSISVEEQDAVLKSLEASMKKNWHFKKVRAKVVKGHEEGIFGWLTVNYLMGRFSPQNHLGTVGVVDVGGATLQLAFEISQQQASRKEHTLSFSIAKKPYNVYVYSYPDFGQNALFKTKPDLQKACSGKFYSPQSLKKRFERCQSLIQTYFQEQCEDLRECGLASVYQAPLEGRFIGIGGMVYLGRELGIESFSLPYLLAKGQESCSLTDREISRKYKGGFLDDTSALCFRLAYLKSMLYGAVDMNPLFNGFGFIPGEVIEVPVEINGHKSFSWMLGAVYFNSVLKFQKRDV